MQQAAVVSAGPTVWNEGKRLFRLIGLWPCVSLLVLAFLFITVALRAGRQSLTSDEALTYLLYLDSSFNKVFFGAYNPNNHVLHTALCWFSIHLFGLNEFNLRIPSVIAGAVYFNTIFRLASLTFGKRVLHVLAVILLAGNPYLLDFFTVARGYGMALSFFSLAFLNALLFARDAHLSINRLFRIAIWSAVSVCSNFAYLFPITALFVTLSVLAYRQAKINQQSLLPVGVELVRSTFGPFLVFSFCLLIMPMHTMDKDAFIFGSLSWRTTIDSLVYPSLLHNGRVPLLGKWPALFWSFYGATGTVIVPVLAVLVCLLAIWALMRWRSENLVLLASAVTFITVFLGLWFAFAFLHVKLPLLRTALYFLILLPLPLLALLGPQSGKLERRIGIVSLPVLVFWAALYIPQWTARTTAEWRYDASTREFAKAIEVMRVACHADNIRVGGSWIFGSSLNFYRLKYVYNHWQPIGRPEKPTEPADYYVLSNADRWAIAARHLRVIIDDPLSESVLAANEAPCSQ